MIGDYKYERGEMTDDHLLEKVTKGWVTRDNETECGSGSQKKNTKLVTKILHHIVKKYDIVTLSDAGAGDLNWIPDNLNVLYQGYDLYPRHEAVVQFDITKEILEKSDLILCRHVLNHLSIDFSTCAINNFKASGSKYLLITNCNNQRNYWDTFDFKVDGELIETLKDCQHWDLELYKL